MAKMKALSKSGLAILLSKLKGFENPKLMSEQYATDSETAAEAIWFAYMNGDIEGKTVADFGCGTGLLGIAALLLGAKQVYFVDNDETALEACRDNIAAAGVDSSKAAILCSSIDKFGEKADTVIQNPPFGTKVKHADREFLLFAFKTAGVVYSFHKIETSGFVRKLADDNKYMVTNILPMQMQLKKTHDFHRSRIRMVGVGFFRIALAA